MGILNSDSVYFRKISFKNYEERVMASEKICTEADQLRQVQLLTYLSHKDIGDQAF